MPPKRREAAGRLQGAPDTNSTDEESAGEADNAAGHARQAPHAPVVPQPPPQQSLFDAQQFVASFMQSFAQSQAEINRNLIETLRSTAVTPSSSASEPVAAAAPAAAAPAAAGNFSNCTARFSGVTRDPEVLEAFLDAAETYRECTAVSDEHAARGLSMLLDGDAAVWWRGVNSSVTTWRDATARLHAVYGTPRPGYKLLREIFAAEQQNERAEIFVCRLRAMIIRLPYVVPEEMQVDMIYCLLDRRIRKRLPRDTIDTVDCLLYKARGTEDAISEVSKITPLSQTNSPTVTTIASVSDSAKFGGAGAQSVTDSRGVIPIASDGKSKRHRVRCSYCKIYGHTVDECRNVRQRHLPSLGTNEIRVNAPAPVTPNSPNTKINAPNTETNELRCYGCGKRGVIRSRCDTCNPPKRADFNNYSDDSCSSLQNSSHPMIMVRSFGLEGVAIADTGATHCIASPKLYEIFVSNDVKFQETQRTIRLADGSQQLRKVLTAEVPISVGGRDFVADFMILPGGETKTLLGFEFITKAGIVLDGSRDTWNFADDPDNQFCLVRKYHLTSSDDAELMRAESSDLSLRSDECARLSPDEQHALNAFIVRRAAQFAPNGPATEFATHRIKVNETQEPIASPPHRISQSRKEALKVELDKLLRDDVIEECESPWASNVVLVSKKDGGFRLCIDYRKLNAVTEPDRYPLPRIEDILHAAKTSKFMTTLDLRSGYFQVSVHPDDRDKTAFITPMGTYRFKRMPMGLRNSGATFQRLIDRFQSYLKDVSILAYLDDLIILSPGPFERHLADLETVFDRLAMFGLRVNRKKSNFARDSVKFLGHVIVPGGIHVDPDKTAAIAGMNTPQNIKHLKCFLQTSSWFRRFIPGYAEVARPLTNLLKRASTWHWGPEQQGAFDHIKSLLVSAPILRQADETKPFVLRTDSSGYCLGAVLMQGEGSDERPIEYASRLLNTAEKNYSTTEREALAVVWAVSKFRGYIEGAQVTVKSDHQPLRWLMSMRSPSGRLARWALTLQEFNLCVEYTPGRANVIADTLSRPVCTEDTSCDLCLAVVDMPSRNKGDVRENQLKDPEIRKIMDDMESDDPFRGRPWSDRGYVMSDGVLYRYDLEGDDNDDALLVVPDHERATVLADFHDAPTAGHFGVERTLSRIRSRFYWPGMRTYVTNHIKECLACQRYKANNRKPAGLLQTPAMSRRFEVVSVDLFGPLVETPRRNKWILIVEDVCTRWVELFPLETATSVECAKTLIDEVFLRYGFPRRLISDNGVQFVSEVMQQACFVLGIDQSLTPYYHPEANPIERKNRDLKPQLAICVGQDHSTWDLHLAAIRYAMNSAVTASTGFSPAHLTFAREIRAPADATTDLRAIVDNDNFVPIITPYLKKMTATLAEARDIHEKAQALQKKYADEGRRQPPDYKVGDLVLLKTQGLNDTSVGQSSKFIPRRDGPYRIKDVLSSTTYSLDNIQDETSLGKYHVSHLTPFIGQIEPPVRPKRRRGRPRRLIES